MSGNWWENDPIAAPPMPPKAKSPADQKRVADLQQGFDEANNLANTATDFMMRNQRTGTGGPLAIPFATSIAKALGVGGPDLSAMDRDSVQMATQLRAPGQRLTQMEFSKNLGAVPSVHSTYDNNAENTNAVYATRTGAAAKSAFYSRWLDTKGSLDGADAAWLNFQQQHFSPDLKTYYHDPNDNPAYARSQGNAALKQRSAQSRTASDPLGIR